MSRSRSRPYVEDLSSRMTIRPKPSVMVAYEQQIKMTYGARAEGDARRRPILLVVLDPLLRSGSPQSEKPHRFQANMGASCSVGLTKARANSVC